MLIKLFVKNQNFLQETIKIKQLLFQKMEEIQSVILKISARRKSREASKESIKFGSSVYFNSQRRSMREVNSRNFSKRNSLVNEGILKNNLIFPEKKLNTDIQSFLKTRYNNWIRNKKRSINKSRALLKLRLGPQSKLFPLKFRCKSKIYSDEEQC